MTRTLRPGRPHRLVRRRRAEPPLRRLPSMAVLPTLCTLGNLVCGFAAIHYASLGPGSLIFDKWSTLSLAGALIFLGMFLDAIDGALARLTQAMSSLGAQLDSLADMVTFGVAPAYMTLQLVRIHLGEGTIIGPETDHVLGRVIWAAAALYVCCAALRLARYNVDVVSGDRDGSSFRGLPSPGAAGAVASLIVLHQHLLVERFAGEVPQSFVQGAAIGIPFVMMACAFMMVSPLSWIHVSNRYFRGAKPFGTIVRIVVPLALALWWFQETVAIVFTLYVLSGPVKWLMARRG